MTPRTILLTCHDAGGTVPPMLAIAEALREVGHRVVMLSQPSVRTRAEAVGCTFAAFTDIPDYAVEATARSPARTVPAIASVVVVTLREKTRDALPVLRPHEPP